MADEAELELDLRYVGPAGLDFCAEQRESARPDRLGRLLLHRIDHRAVGIRDYAGTGIARPAIAHLGIEAEGLGVFEGNIACLTEANTALCPYGLEATPENRQRFALLRSGGLGNPHDPDEVPITVRPDAGRLSSS